MLVITRGAVFLSLLVFIVPLYCGSLYWVWPCRGDVVGRELRQTKLMRDVQPPCEKHQGSVFMELQSQGSMVKKHDNLKKNDKENRFNVAAIADDETFTNPFDSESYEKAITDAVAYLDASQASTVNTLPTNIAADRTDSPPLDLNACVAKDWDQTTGHYIAAYHSRERSLAAGMIIADPDCVECNSNICPKNTSYTAALNAWAETHGTAVDAKITALKNHMGGDGEPDDNSDRDATAAVHFADVEHKIRAAIGQAQLPYEGDAGTEYIAAHWVPFVNDLFTKMSENGLEGGFTIPAVHNFLTKDQLEKVRASAKSGSLFQEALKNPHTRWGDVAKKAALLQKTP